MPCRDEGHEHSWPKSGTLTICKCEIFCGYCEGDDAQKIYMQQWELRHHVRVVHARAQGLIITVSPRPMPHVSTNSKKRNHAEVEQDNTGDDDDDDNDDDDDDDDDNDDDAEDEESSEEEEGREEESRGEDSKTKPKRLSLHSRAPSDPFVDEDIKDTKPASAPLRLAAKPVLKPKKAPLRSHAASFRPVGPKPGPSSPKRTRQQISTEFPPPAAMNMASGAQPQPPRVQQDTVQLGSMPNARSVNNSFHEQQRARAFARNAVDAQAGMRFPRSAGMSQQIPNNEQPQARNNVDLPINPQPGQVPNQNYGRAYPPASQSVHSNGPTHLSPPGFRLQSFDQGFYRRNPQFPDQPNAPFELQRIRNMTADLLTNNNVSEMILINMYSVELEFVRELMIRRYLASVHDQVYASTVDRTSWIAMQQVKQQLQPQFMQQVVGGYVHAHLRGIGFVIQQGQGQGDQQQGRQQQDARLGQQPGLQQQGGQHYGSRPVQQQPQFQQPGQGQQVGGQHGGQQPQQQGPRACFAGQHPGLQQPDHYHPVIQQSGKQQTATHQPDYQHTVTHQPDLQQSAPQQPPPTQHQNHHHPSQLHPLPSPKPEDQNPLNQPLPQVKPIKKESV